MRKGRQQLFVDLKMPTGLKHSGSMIDVTLKRPDLLSSTVESQRQEVLSKPKIGTKVYELEERSKHIDIY